MKRRTFFSILVFGGTSLCILAGVVTQELQGVLESKDFGFFIGMSVTFGAVFAGIFYPIFSFFEAAIADEEHQQARYAPSAKALIIPAVIFLLGLGYMVRVSYTVGVTQAADKAKVKEAVASARAAVERQAEAERQRVAALTPEQRAAEEKAKADKAAAQEKQRLANIAKTKADADAAEKQKNRHSVYTALAAQGAIALKHSMKDPDAFELKSITLYPNGATCYEYRSTNSYGAHLRGSAVFEPGRKMLIEEHDGNEFVRVWNNACTRGGGEDLMQLLTLSHLLDG